VSDTHLVQKNKKALEEVSRPIGYGNYICEIWLRFKWAHAHGSAEQC